MAYDETLAERVRARLDPEKAVTEKAMFGGLAFMLDGNMAVCVSGRGGLMVRVGPTEAESALAEPHVQPMDMGGRPMSGWVRVDPEGLENDAQLASWVDRGAAFARSLPPKPG